MGVGGVSAAAAVISARRKTQPDYRHHGNNPEPFYQFFHRTLLSINYPHLLASLSKSRKPAFFAK
jgi:hypothetical protein